jgi:hypothetical protein
MSIIINNAAREVTIAKLHTLQVDVAQFNDDVLTYLFNYGLKQVLNDAGSAGKSADEKLAMAETKLAALYAGELRKQREAGEPADPVGKEAFRIAGDLVAKLLGRIYKGEWKCPDMAKARAFAAKHELDLSDAETFLGEARKIVAKTERVRTEAQANVEMAAQLADLI